MRSRNVTPRSRDTAIIDSAFAPTASAAPASSGTSVVTPAPNVGSSSA
jgi:hypothetical protein